MHNIVVHTIEVYHYSSLWPVDCASRLAWFYNLDWCEWSDWSAMMSCKQRSSTGTGTLRVTPFSSRVGGIKCASTDDATCRRSLIRRDHDKQARPRPTHHDPWGASEFEVVRRLRHRSVAQRSMAIDVRKRFPLSL